MNYFATRKPLYDVFQQFGSYYGFTNFLAVILLGASQRHHLNKSIIKKLYSSNPDKEQNMMDFDNDNRGNGSALNKDQQLFNESKDMRLKKDIQERHVFSYGYWRGVFISLFDNKWYCCFIKRKKRDDFLQEDAMKKLNREMDILEIVKKLRISYFASEVTLKPRQRNLIGFFDDYRLKTPDEELEDLIKSKNDPNIH